MASPPDRDRGSGRSPQGGVPVSRRSSSTGGTAASATEGTGTGDQGPSDPSWLELPIGRPWGSTTFLVFEVIPDGVKVTAVDPATWRVLGRLTRAVPPGWGFRPSSRALRVFRAVRLAQSPENLESGTRLEGLHWWGVRVYGLAEGGPWRPRNTSRAVRHPTRGGRLEVKIPLARCYVEDYVDIRLDL